eukprot:TRINITY_DN2332_c0_g1_i1.p1 TRINITY_DN2332_c0_g1~~TRINITY_DN2332_c0_g1_i1.p1  ORF type:complete len:543 (-),score=60.46 TRINITY_DN2332_c0_g1_i1:190-1818(-)
MNELSRRDLGWKIAEAQKAYAKRQRLGDYQRLLSANLQLTLEEHYTNLEQVQKSSTQITPNKIVDPASGGNDGIKNTMSHAEIRNKLYNLLHVDQKSVDNSFSVLDQKNHKMRVRAEAKVKPLEEEQLLEMEQLRSEVCETFAHLGGWRAGMQLFDMKWIREALQNQNGIISLLDKQNKRSDLTRSNPLLNQSAAKCKPAIQDSTISLRDSDSYDCQALISIAGILVDYLPNELIVVILLNLKPKELCTLRLCCNYWNRFVQVDFLFEFSVPSYLRSNMENPKCRKKWKQIGVRRHWIQTGLKPPDYAALGIIRWYFPDDRCGLEFWRLYFLDKVLQEIPWIEFATKFYNFISQKTEPKFTIAQLEQESHPKLTENIVALHDYRCLKALLCRDGKLSVNIEDFSALLKWFGPFSNSYSYNRQNILTRIRKTLKYSAFHGFISSSALRKKLDGFPTGTFAIRFSETAPGYFVLARVHQDGNVTEGRMCWDKKKGFTVGCYSARTLTRFCRELRKNLNLQYICGKRSYERLFTAPKISHENATN